MYGPKQRYRDPFEKVIPKWYRCNHTHVSGRHCKQTVMKLDTACEMCQPVGSTDYCAECLAMMRAFGMKP